MGYETRKFTKRNRGSSTCRVQRTRRGTQKNIGELLGGNDPSKLVVPEFQRGYSWEKKHVAAFWKDIIDLQKDDTRENHFLGPMVTLPKSKNVTELLDGQQRLATATILFSVLRDVAHDLGDKDSPDFARDIQNQFILKEGTSGYALDLGETDNLYFRDSIQSFPAGKKKPTLRSHNKIHSAKILLTESVKAHLGPAAPGPALTLLVSLKRTLRSHLVMTVIPVTSDQDAFWIFETLNDRGCACLYPTYC
jgi:uncharacterized protein with ParB-like and HNH nuclease domain